MEEKELKSSCPQNHLKEEEFESSDKLSQSERKLHIALKKLSNAHELCAAQEKAIREAKAHQIKSYNQCQKYKFQVRRAQEKLEAVERQEQIKRLRKSCHDMVKVLDVKRNRCKEIEYDDDLSLPIKTDTRMELNFLRKSLEQSKRKYDDQQRLLDTLIERNSLDNEMKRAALEGDATKIRHLMDKGVSVNTPDETGISPFQYACGQGHIDAVNAMMPVADINNEDGRWTPLHIALEYCQSEITAILIKENANVFLTEENGEYPLHIACRKSCIKCVSILVSKGEASVDVQNKMGDTPLHYCAKANTFEIASFLLENGADLTVKNVDGLTPIVVAKTNRNNEVSKVFEMLHR